MGIRAARNAIAAGVLTCATAFAQTSQTPTQTPAQTGTQPETPITLVGCVQREADYRREQDKGRGGALGTGAGAGNEYVLMNASIAAAGTSTPTATTEVECKPGGTGEAYELTGNRERELEGFVGRRIEITGMLKRAETETAGTAGTAGTAKPTGGMDPMGQDLRLHEVNVTSFREVGVKPPPPEPEAAAAPEPEAAVRPEPVQPEPQPTGTSGVPAELPQTASPLPLAGLIGLFSVGAALGIRSVARRR